MRGSKKSGVIAGCFLFLMILTVGCGKITLPEQIMTSTIAVSATGQVDYWLVERFEKDYYDVEELRQMVQNETDAFNAEHAGEGGNAMTFAGLERMPSGESVRLHLIFRDASCYKAYTGNELFYGTIAQAKAAGYQVGENLITVRNGAAADAAKVSGMDRRHVLIVQEKVQIYGPRMPIYVSSGCVVEEDGALTPAKDMEGNIYLITW